jgi:hypothetical protein
MKGSRGWSVSLQTVLGASCSKALATKITENTNH